MISNTGRTVYTGGSFDLLHAGHVDFLRQCNVAAGYPYGQVIVSLNTDEFITEFKGRPPVCSYEERAEVLQAIRYVHRVIPNVGGVDSKPAILEARPDLVIIGSDWAPEAGRDYHAQMGFTPEWLVEHDIKLAYVERKRQISTTDLRARTVELDVPSLALKSGVMLNQQQSAELSAALRAARFGGTELC